jgi:hypothetical protein
MQQQQQSKKGTEKNVIAAVRFYIDKIVSDSSIIGENFNVIHPIFVITLFV